MHGARTAETRIELLDLLRGFALLGILVINVRFFALPLLRWNDPFTSIQSIGTAELLAWLLGQVFFEHEMIALFSMLFGAGLVLGSARQEDAGLMPARSHYRRMFWLLCIGAAHALLLWYGDILMAYAVCGAVVFPLRRLTPRLLLALGVLVLLVAPLIRALPEAEPKAGLEASAVAAPSIGQRWQTLAYEEPRARSAGYVEQLRWRARVDVLWHAYGFGRFTFWLAAGFMLIGMALLGAGLLDGRRETPAYLRLSLVGYGLGLPLLLSGVHPQVFDALIEANRSVPGSVQQLAAFVFPSPLPAPLHHPLRYVGGALVAFGHLGAVVLLYRAGWLGPLARALCAVGRMTLSAYLLQSLICAWVFNGWGLGYWDRLDHLQQLGLVGGIWILELIAAPLWLRFFRLGPVEWLWRSLTAGSLQPMRIR